MARQIRVRVKATGVERTVNERSYQLAEKQYIKLGVVEEPIKVQETVTVSTAKTVNLPSDPNSGAKPGDNQLREDYKAAFGRYPRSDWSEEVIKEKLSTLIQAE